jgi:hypothetical protein
VDDDGALILGVDGQPIIAYHYIPSTLRDNPHVSPEYRKELMQMFADNPEWQKAYLDGDWNAFSSLNQVIPTHWISEAVKRKATAGWPVIWGLDCARFGKDKTVLVERRGFKFRIIDSWNNRSIDWTADHVLNLYRDALVKPSRINIDDIGVGGGVVDLIHRGGAPAYGINVGRPSRHPDRYFNLKAEIWWEFRRLMESGEVELPNDPELKSSLSVIRYEFVPSTQRIQIEDKGTVRVRLGRSPDEADALVLASWEGVPSFVLYDRPEDRKTVNTKSVDPALIDAKRRQTVSQLLKIMKYQ